MNDKDKRRISKKMSLVLRHRPMTLGLELDDQGWCSVESLLKGFNDREISLNFEQLQIVVAENNKQRFSFNEDQTLIRANQGHSVDIDLGIEASTPPSVLYHGTAEKYLTNIKHEGLKKRTRNHVHLSSNKETALQVGKRHGNPVILTIQAEEMYSKGFEFFISKNKIWLTESVPIEFIEF